MKTSAMTVLSLAAVASIASGQVLNEDLKLTASDAAVSDQFGVSVSISGTRAVAGAPFDNDGGNASGSAYLFDVATGHQFFKLTASDAAAGDFFGNSAAISGTRAIVGVPFDDDGGDASGSAYLFSASSGTQIAKLLANDGAAVDQFGFSVAISGTRAIVGAPFDDDNANDSGSAYLFDVTTGLQFFKLTASDAAADDRFGSTVAISGTTAIVGAPFDDDGGFDSGSAYLFDTTTGQQLFKLTAADAAEGDFFGNSVAISGTRAIVGARFDDDGAFNSGSAYVFDTATGQQLFKLTANDAGAGDFFGDSVAISGTRAIVGAFADGDGGSESGSAYLFDVTTGQQLFKLTASDAAVFDHFGNSVAISGTAAIVGAPFDDDNGQESGSAYLFDLSLPCPGDIADDFGTPGADGMVSTGDFLALLGLVGPCPGGVPGCTGDFADATGSLGADGMVDFGDFLALLGLVGPCP